MVNSVLQQGLQQRLLEQEKSVDVLKAELLRAGFCQQSLENTKVHTELTDYDSWSQYVM